MGRVLEEEKGLDVCTYAQGAGHWVRSKTRRGESEQMRINKNKKKAKKAKKKIPGPMTITCPVEIDPRASRSQGIFGAEDRQVGSRCYERYYECVWDRLLQYVVATLDMCVDIKEVSYDK